MGCSNSKLENQEVVQICKDRKRFIKEALEHRIKFATGHVAYLHALKRVSVALHDFVLVDDHQETMFNVYANPAFPPLKHRPETAKSISSTPIEFETSNSLVVNCLRSGGNPSVSIEERVQSPETMRVEAYVTSPISYHGGLLGSRSPLNSSFGSSPYKPSFPPPSPQASQWDFFWNPFCSLDSFRYPFRNSLDQTSDDEITGLKRIREECVSDLEEGVIGKRRSQAVKEKKVENEEDRSMDNESSTARNGLFTTKEASDKHSKSIEGIEPSEVQNVVELEVANKEEDEGDHRENQTPTSLAEIIENIENQFIIASDSANEVSRILEVINEQNSSTPNEITAIKMLNPVALFCSASSNLSSSRTFPAFSSSRENGYDSSIDFSEESYIFSGSHHSTLDRLYAWEKKLYEEVKSGERIRMACEKKCMQLRNQDGKSANLSDVGKIKLAIRDLQTQIKVSIHSVESVAKRIETLRDEELQPQLMELIQGLAQMWKAMAECHQSQKQILTTTAGISNSLAGKSSENRRRSTINLRSSLQNWQTCFSSCVYSHRAYIRALNSWLLCCLHLDSFSPSKSGSKIGAPPIFDLCARWFDLTGDVREFSVIDSLKAFSGDVKTLSEQLGEEVKQKKRVDQIDGKLRVMCRLPESGEVAGDSGKMLAGRVMEIERVREELEVEREREREMTKKTANYAVRVLLEGLGNAVGCLVEFAVNSAEGYGELAEGGVVSGED